MVLGSDHMTWGAPLCFLMNLCVPVSKKAVRVADGCANPLRCLFRTAPWSWA